MGFAKFVLIAVIVTVIVLGILLRVRRWLADRRARAEAERAAIERELSDDG